MSYDLFLFRLDADADFNAASVQLDRLVDEDVTDPAFDARDAIDTLLSIEPRYKRPAVDYAALARRRGTTEEAVRRQFNFVQVLGPVNVPLAMFTFCSSYISVNCGSGTSAEELERYLTELCRATGYSVLDPQSGEIRRLQASGELS
jgi:hypothetical protein